MIRVADYIMNFIYTDLDVKDVFMVSGGGIMQLTDAIKKHGKLNYICSQNEQATSMEVDGYSKANEKFGVGVVTSGPGATNAITGVVGAWMDSIPCMIISGQSKKIQTVYNAKIKNLRQFGSQEVNILPIIKTVTKYSCMVNDPNKIRYYLEKAVFYSKEGRQGPVWLDIPLDVQGSLIDPEKLKGFKLYNKISKSKLSKGHLNYVLKLLKNSKRPLIIAGGGVRLSKSQNKFIKLVEYLNIPVVTPRLGIDIMDTGHKLYIGRIGVKGNRPGNFAVQNADLIICIGTRLSINATGHDYKDFGRNAKIVVVDIDKDEHKKQTIIIDKFIHSNASDFINSLYESVKKESLVYPEEWPNICRNWKNKYPVTLPSYKNEKMVNTYYFTDILSDYLNAEDIIVIDSGSSSYVLSQAIKIKQGQRFIASGGLGSMGYALPASIGASIAKNKKRIICITGDGSLQFNIQELQIISHDNLPIKVFIFNNNSYSSIYYTQHNYFNDRFIGVDKNSGVYMPSIEKIGGLYNIKTIKIENNEEVGNKIKEILDYDGPIICDIVCDKSQLIIPTVYSVKNEDGTFTSRPLEDMYPFLDKEELQNNMIKK